MAVEEKLCGLAEEYTPGGRGKKLCNTSRGKF
jgi:hypothetical protein